MLKQHEKINHYSKGVFLLRYGPNPFGIMVYLFGNRFIPNYFRCSYELRKKYRKIFKKIRTAKKMQGHIRLL